MIGHPKKGPKLCVKLGGGGGGGWVVCQYLSNLGHNLS